MLLSDEELLISLLVRCECGALPGGPLGVMKTEPSCLLYASQQEVEIDETRIGLPSSNGSAHSVVVQGFFSRKN